MNLVDRVKNILLTPKTEWPVIEAEQTDVKSLYIGYIMILAAIPAVASIISTMMLGGMMGAIGGRTGLGAGMGGGFAVAHGLASYVVTLVVIFVVALIVDALAPSFGGQKNQVNALKLVAYSATAGWVASIATIVPVLGWIIAIAGSIYGIYLLYLGLPVLMKCPEDKAVIYLIVVVVVYIVLSWIFMSLIVAGVFGSMMLGAR
ncbi:MAG: YIP1 family protein [Betaproteobacteria bacterium]|nr:YIP1 family protein [Betaproteobacteria bacterium]MBK8741325.1 YIP1 family protein [Betaproteobacteria bacterium]MBK9606288.1 YIP1 family protein [Betaproteobacteria bacterium]